MWDIAAHRPVPLASALLTFGQKSANPALTMQCGFLPHDGACAAVVATREHAAELPDEEIDAGRRPHHQILPQAEALTESWEEFIDVYIGALGLMERRCDWTLVLFTVRKGGDLRTALLAHGTRAQARTIAMALSTARAKLSTPT